MIETESSGQRVYASPRPAIGYGNFDAVITPTENDDESAGYSINSIWYKESVPYRLWICVDNSDGAAIWREIPLVETAHRALFDQFTDAPTTGTARETLYSNSIPAYTLFNNGDKIFFRYSGGYALGLNNSRYLYVNAFGADIAESGDQAGNGTAWEINGWIMRESSSVVRYESTFVTVGVDPNVTAAEITGLDLTTDYDFNLEARTALASGDLTAIMGSAWYIPAAPEGVTTLTSESGDTLIDESSTYDLIGE